MPLSSCNHFVPFHFQFRERKGVGRNSDLLFYLFIAFIGYFLIEPASLAYQEDALAKWATWPGLRIFPLGPKYNLLRLVSV